MADGIRTRQQREDRRLTAAVEQATGKFHCSSSAHWATGAPVIIRGRKVCQACATKRRATLARRHDHV